MGFNGTTEHHGYILSILLKVNLSIGQSCYPLSAYVKRTVVSSE